MRLGIDEAAALLAAAHRADDRVRKVHAAGGAIEARVESDFPADGLPAHYHGYEVVIHAGKRRERATGATVA